MNAKVVELVGLPGTGKSTLSRALLASAGGPSGLVKLRRWRNLPFLARNGLLFSLPFALQYRKLPEHRWRRFSQMVQLLTFYDAVAAEMRGRELILLDQGPVYLMSILQRTLLAPGSNSRLYEAHWHATLARWAKRLDLVVRLDAGDDVLHERILTRGTRHPLLGLDRAQARQHLGRMRRSHDRILAAIQHHSPAPAILRIDTERLSVQETVEQILDRVLGARVRPQAASGAPYEPG